MWRVLLALLSISPPEVDAVEPAVEPEPDKVEQPKLEPPPPVVIIQAESVEPPLQPPRIHRCLYGVEPCYRTTSARLLLGSAGLIASGTSFALMFTAGDRNRIGDPAIAIASAGMVAVSSALIGGFAALVGGDGATLPDRITVATFSLGLAAGGTTVTDEKAPFRLSGSFAPTISFPRNLGRLRVLGQVGGGLGNSLERDPRPQVQVPDNGAGGTFSTALESSTLRVQGGLDLAIRLPYPLARRSPWLGQFELRYKPLVFFAHETLRLSDGESERVSQQIAMAPLNLGFRWHVSPRQRFTFYLGPRWDFVGYGERGAVTIGGPALGPIYSESWFDLDVPLQRGGAARRASVVGQFTLGYVHSRFDAGGINFGAVVGFLGYAVGQFAVRVRPRDSAIAYQIEVGARAGEGVSPYLRFGIVLPNIEVKR